MLDGGVNFLIHIVLNDAGHLVLLIGDRRVVPQVGQGQVGHHHLGRHPLLGRLSGEARQTVPGFFLVGLGQGLLDRAELVDMVQQLGFEYQMGQLLCAAGGPAGCSRSIAQRKFSSIQENE